MISSTSDGFFKNPIISNVSPGTSELPLEKTKTFF
jgi:hypothetical protein